MENGGNRALFVSDTSESPPKTGISLQAAGPFTGDVGPATFPSSVRLTQNCGVCGKPKQAQTRSDITGRADDSAGQNNPRAGRRAQGELFNVHPTVKPIKLMRWLVRLVTPPGGLVCDPFLGSGTTLIAAQAEGMRGIGIEREPAYVDIACARIQAAL